MLRARLDGCGIGFVIQAYQKRAPFVIDYVIDLARRSRHRVMVRLVNAWDSGSSAPRSMAWKAIRSIPARSTPTWPTWLAPASCWARPRPCIRSSPRTTPTRCRPSISWPARTTTPVSTSSSACTAWANRCTLVGPLAQGKLNRPCRIYAPVGTHETLLAYLVRRLLENGANTSFVNLIGDESIPVEQLVSDPVDAASRVVPLGAPHEKIPLPRELFGSPQEGARANSAGLDLSNEHRLGSLSAALLASAGMTWRAGPMLGEGAQAWDAARAVEVRNPANLRDLVGHVVEANAEEAEAALSRPMPRPSGNRRRCRARAMPAPRRATAGRADADVAGPDRARSRQSRCPTPSPRCARPSTSCATTPIRRRASSATTRTARWAPCCASALELPWPSSPARSPPRWRPAIPCWPSPPSRRR